MPRRPPRPGPDDPAVLIPTSGTTGRSKLVTQTHRAYAMAGEGFPWWMELGPDDRLMTSLPLFHINAPAYSVLGSVAARAGLVLLPRFSASGFLDAARRHGATEFNAIGAMLEILMRQPEREDDADTPLRLCYTGPAPSEARQIEIEERFGLRIVCGYALSESPYGMIWPHGTRPFGTLGTVRQHPRLGTVNEARVIAEGGPVPDGEVGELELRNPAVMRGYWGMPEETAEVVDPDGWLRTGDLVHRNADGTYTFVGRQKEVIRRRGENVAPAEIEEALCAHPDVTEAAVIGVPSELTEEEIKGVRRRLGSRVGRPGRDPPGGRRPARPVQGAALPRGRGRAPAHADRARRQARARARADARRDGLRRRARPRPEGRMSDSDWLRTEIGGADADSITVRGRDLASDLMGRVTFTELTYLLVQGRSADRRRRRCSSTPCSCRLPSTG